MFCCQKRRGRYYCYFFVAVLVCFYLALNLASPAAHSQTSWQEEHQSAEEEQQRVEKILRELETDLLDLNVEMAVLENQLAGLGLDAAGARQEANRLESEVEVLEQQLAGGRAELQSWIGFIYREGRVPFLAVLLNSRSISEFLTRYHLLDIVVSHQQDMVTQTAATAEVLQEHEEAWRNKEADLQEMYARVERALARLEYLRREKEERMVEARSASAAVAEKVILLDRQWTEGLPALAYFLERFSSLPLENLEPDRVDVNYLTGRLRLEISAATLEKTFLTGLPELNQLSFQLDHSLAAIRGGRSQGDGVSFYLAGTIDVVSGGGLKFTPAVLAIDGRTVGENVLASLVESYQLTLNLPEISPGVKAVGVELTPGAMVIEYRQEG